MAKVSVYKIDKDVPMPEPDVSVIPLDDMEIGDSILFPIEDRPRVQPLASKLKARKDKVFTIRVVDKNNCRVWRIE